MKPILIISLLTSMCIPAFASTDPHTTCLIDKYDRYVDTSLTWYSDLLEIATTQYPELQEVSSWFYQGRKNHFELNRALVHQYLLTDKSKVATEQPIESWLGLSQADIKALSYEDSETGKLAAQSFADRQSAPHPKNYQLRSAFVDLLSRPDKIQTALNRYNQSMSEIEDVNCP